MIRLELSAAEARDVHSALGVVDELLAQVQVGPGAVLTRASRPGLQLVARRLDHELRHEGPNPWAPADADERGVLVACDNCAYSGSTRGSAAHVVAGGECVNCGGGRYREWVTR